MQELHRREVPIHQVYVGVRVKRALADAERYTMRFE